MIKISKKRYAELLRAEYTLESLEAGGVDNWINYDYAMDDIVDDMPSARDFCDMDDDEVIEFFGKTDEIS